jgi:hypothetical protein
MKIQIFHLAKIQSSNKNPLKTNQNPSRYHNSITNNLKVSTQAQMSSKIIFQKSSYKNYTYYDDLGAKIP